jgi:hypothetical protein
MSYRYFSYRGVVGLHEAMDWPPVWYAIISKPGLQNISRGEEKRTGTFCNWEQTTGPICEVNKKVLDSRQEDSEPNGARNFRNSILICYCRSTSMLYFRRIHLSPVICIVRAWFRPALWWRGMLKLYIYLYTTYLICCVSSGQVSLPQGGFLLTWHHGSARQGDRCTAGREAHANLADESGCLMADNVWNEVVTVHKSQEVFKMSCLHLEIFRSFIKNTGTTILLVLTAHQTPTFTEWLRQLCCRFCSRLRRSSLFELDVSAIFLVYVQV